MQVLSLEGSIGLSQGEPSMSLRALLARETDRGLETLAGEILSARTIALEVLVTALDDVALERALDPVRGRVAPRRRRAEAAAPRNSRGGPWRPRAAPPRAWSSALEASEHVEARPRPAASPSAPGVAPAVMPQRPPPARTCDLDTPVPEPGDHVDHFAFGRADVVKSDGDRLHLRCTRTGASAEIALEMLRVSRLPDARRRQAPFRSSGRM